MQQYHHPTTHRQINPVVRECPHLHVLRTNRGTRRCRAGILGSPELFVDLGYLASLGSLRLLGMYLARFVTKLYFS